MALEHVTFEFWRSYMNARIDARAILELATRRNF